MDLLSNVSNLDLVKRAVANARPMRGTRETRVASVKRALAVGRFSAYQLCLACELEPDEELFGGRCEGCENDLPICEACGEPIEQEQDNVGIECDLHDFCAE